ncbi:MAG: cell filamentation protein Fic [Candidatus Accumulibacter sp.]|jgi:hypothetical protein|nr:cell filamentation protein Fic [Accumulibacter sp.]
MILLSKEHAQRLHRKLLKQTGGTGGIRDKDLLELILLASR